MQGLLSPQGSSGAVAPNSSPVSLDLKKPTVSQILRAWKRRRDPEVVLFAEESSVSEKPTKIGDPSWENLIDQLLQDLQIPSTRLDDLSFVPPSSKHRAFLPMTLVVLEQVALEQIGVFTSRGRAGRTDRQKRSHRFYWWNAL